MLFDLQADIMEYELASCLTVDYRNREQCIIIILEENYRFSLGS